MKDIQIVRVSTQAHKKAFVDFPLGLYQNNPYFVPPLYADEMAQFKKKHAYSDTCDTVFFLAMQGKSVVGRIQGILQKQSNDLRGEMRVRFTRFDAIDDVDVARALFAAVEDWAREQGMDTVCGPLGYSDLEREGLLIEGFDQLSTFEEQYNYDYYPALLEACGYQKEIDWLEHRLKAPENPNPMLGRVAERALEPAFRRQVGYGGASFFGDDGRCAFDRDVHNGREGRSQICAFALSRGANGLDGRKK